MMFEYAREKYVGNFDRSISCLTIPEINYSTPKMNPSIDTTFSLLEGMEY